MRRSLFLAAGLVLSFGTGTVWADAVQMQLQEGRYAHVQGRLEQAAFEYRMALKYDIFAHEPHFHLGVALYQLGRSTEAAKEFRKAIQSKSKDPMAHVMLGLASLDPVEKGDEYRTAVNAEPLYGAPGFDPDEVLLKRKLLPTKPPRSPLNSQRWAALSALEAAPAVTPAGTPAVDPAAGDTPASHGSLAAGLYEKSKRPALSKEEAAELRRQAAAEYMKAATLSLAP